RGRGLGADRVRRERPTAYRPRPSGRPGRVPRTGRSGVGPRPPRRPGGRRRRPRRPQPPPPPAPVVRPLLAGRPFGGRGRDRPRVRSWAWRGPALPNGWALSRRP